MELSECCEVVSLLLAQADSVDKVVTSRHCIDIGDVLATH